MSPLEKKIETSTKKWRRFMTVMHAIIIALLAHISVEFFKLGTAFIQHAATVQADIKEIKNQYAEHEKKDDADKDVLKEQVKEHASALSFHSGQISSLQRQQENTNAMMATISQGLEAIQSHHREP